MLRWTSRAIAFYLTHPASSSFIDALAWYDAAAIFFPFFFSFSCHPDLRLRGGHSLDCSWKESWQGQGCVAMAGIYVSHDDLGVGEAWYSLGRDRPLQSYRALQNSLNTTYTERTCARRHSRWQGPGEVAHNFLQKWFCVCLRNFVLHPLYSWVRPLLIFGQDCSSTGRM